MLATIIIDSFTKAEVGEIAAALDELCSPMDDYAFSSAAIYSFWSVPEQEILYIGLAKDVTQRFKQHTGLVACDPACCKSRELADYFSTKDRIGYSVIVQSTMCSPLTKDDEETIRKALDDDAATVDVRDIFEAEENIAVAEGMLIELFEQLDDRLPKWNKIRGAERGRQQRSFYSLSSRMKAIQGKLAGKSLEEIEEEINAETPYELLLSLEGSELSQLNARATLREIADNATFCEHELLLHGIRMGIVSLNSSFEQALDTQLTFNEFAKGRVDQMKEDGYWERKVSIPGL